MKFFYPKIKLSHGLILSQKEGGNILCNSTNQKVETISETKLKSFVDKRFLVLRVNGVKGYNSRDIWYKIFWRKCLE